MAGFSPCGSAFSGICPMASARILPNTVMAVVSDSNRFPSSATNAAPCPYCSAVAQLYHPHRRKSKDMHGINVTRVERLMVNNQQHQPECCLIAQAKMEPVTILYSLPLPAPAPGSSPDMWHSPGRSLRLFSCCGKRRRPIGTAAG